MVLKYLKNKKEEGKEEISLSLKERERG